MRPLPYDHPVAAAVFWGAYVLFSLVELVVAVRSRLRSAGRAAPLDRASKHWLVGSIWVALATGFGVAGAVPAAAIAVSQPMLRWVLFALGVALIVVGVALRQWAISTLGRFFTLEVRVCADQQVIDSGPYRLVRHPSYAAALTTFLGIGLALGNWLALAVVMVLPTVGFIHRIRIEERAMLEQLGNSYRRYAASHRRLLPGIW